MYPALRDAVATQLAQKWSPQQIAGWLRQAYPDDPTMHVSHETIYLSLFVQSRGVLKKALQAQLRQRRTIRRPRAAAPKTGGYIVGAVSIRERPATVEDRAVPGHWEGDLLVGGRQSYVATLVERRSRYVCLVRLTGKDTQTVVQALTQHVQRLPVGLMATLTWIAGWSSRPIAPFRSPRACRSTSVTRRVRGSAGPTRTPTGCCASICRRGPTSLATPKPSLMRLRAN